MPFRAAIIISPLVLLVSFWLHAHFPQFVWYNLLATGIILFISLRVIWRKQFSGFWHSHAALLLFYLSSVGQFYLFEDARWRWFYAALVALIWFWLSVSMQVYVGRVREYASRQLLQINQATSLLTVWQTASFAYFALSQLHTAIWLIILLLLVIVVLIMIDIIHLHQIRKSSPFMVVMAVTATVLELFLVIYLLPLHLYVQSSLLTLWFFFVTELTIEGQEVKSRRRLFISYLLFMAVAGMVLLLISLL